MQEEKEIEEAFELMAEHILKLDRMIRVLYERQNGQVNVQNDSGLSGEGGTDEGDQIPLTGL